MAAAALIISVLALAAALASASYTYRQAAATEDLRDYERERRAEERRPAITWLRREQTDVLTVELVNEGPVDVDHIEVAFPAGQQSALPATGFDVGQGPTTRLEIAGLAVGASKALRVTRNHPDGSGTFRVVVTAHAGDESWTYPIAERFDASPQVW